MEVSEFRDRMNRCIGVYNYFFTNRDKYGISHLERVERLAAKLKSIQNSRSLGEY